MVQYRDRPDATEFIIDSKDYCSTCKTKENLMSSPFNRQVQKKTGYIHEYFYCKPCNAKRSVVYRKTEKGKIVADKIKEKVKLTSPEKLRARAMVNNAIATKRLIRPQNCSKCGGNQEKIHGHHFDYSKPLEVVWLCTTCHVNLHNELRSACGDIKEMKA